MRSRFAYDASDPSSTAVRAASAACRCPRRCDHVPVPQCRVEFLPSRTPRAASVNALKKSSHLPVVVRTFLRPCVSPAKQECSTDHIFPPAGSPRRSTPAPPRRSISAWGSTQVFPPRFSFALCQLRRRTRFFPTTSPVTSASTSFRIIRCTGPPHFVRVRCRFTLLSGNCLGFCSRSP